MGNLMGALKYVAAYGALMAALTIGHHSLLPQEQTELPPSRLEAETLEKQPEQTPNEPNLHIGDIIQTIPSYEGAPSSQ